MWGSFEPGVFALFGGGNHNAPSLRAGLSVLTGWQVVGVGVAWLRTALYGAKGGVHAIDLRYSDGGAGSGSGSITVPTTVGASNAIDFTAAAVAGYPSFTNAGSISLVSTPVAEPGSWVLFASGLAAFGGLHRRRD